MTLNGMQEEKATEELVESKIESEVEEVEQQELQEEVGEETTEEVEITDSEETEEKTKEVENAQKKVFTEEELEEIAKKREARAISKLERKYEKELSKYKELENLMKVGTGQNEINGIYEATKKYYEEEGIEIPKNEVGLSDGEIEVLAKYKAEQILKHEDLEIIEEEANALAQKGIANMTKEERIIFETLGKKLTEQKDIDELKKIGVDKAVLDSPEFKQLREKFVGSAQEVYDIYKKIYVKEEKPASAGDLKTKPVNVDKEFYSASEAEKIANTYSPEDLVKNPKLLERLKNSMNNW